MAPDILDGHVCSDQLSQNEIEEESISSTDVHCDKTVNLSSDKKWDEKKSYMFRTPIKWDMVIIITLYHVLALYMLGTVLHKLKHLYHWITISWAWMIGMLGSFGMAGGVHRLWTHRGYKANATLRSILMLGFMSAGQNSIYQWVRDHRVHHKFTETDADPHNSTRGFFFSHVGWLMVQKHPDVLSKGKEIDMSDVMSDPVVIFCERYYQLLKFLMCFAIPISVPVLFWDESWYNSTTSQIVRHIYVLNVTWTVNSWAHMFGDKPYDKSIAPVESRWVSYWTLGEGWHNYHHAFPWDYRAAEIGGNRFNLTTKFIDFFAKIGWAYDLKETSNSVVKNLVSKKGDGTYELYQ